MEHRASQPLRHTHTILDAKPSSLTWHRLTDAHLTPVYPLQGNRPTAVQALGQLTVHVIYIEEHPKAWSLSEDTERQMERQVEETGTDLEKCPETLCRLLCSPLCRVCLPPDSTPLGSMPVGVSPFNVSTFSLSSLYKTIYIYTNSHKSCMSEAFLD